MPTPIPTPLHLKLRRLRYSVLPLITFALAVALSAWLWVRHGSATQAVGEVSVLTIHLVAPHDGRLTESAYFPKLYDRVTINQQLGRLEPIRTSAIGGALDERTLLAPASGSVTTIHRRPGEFVKQGQEILTITRLDSQHIVTYARGDTRTLPAKNSKVLIRSKQVTASARVEEVGVTIEPIPDHQHASSKHAVEWGIPIRISLPDPAILPLRPGELVSLTYLPDAK